jgi:hypothetical protein
MAKTIRIGSIPAVTKRMFSSLNVMFDKSTKNSDGKAK